MENYIAFLKEMHEKAYKIYVTDALQLLTKKFGGEYLKESFCRCDRATHRGNKNG